MSINDIHKLFWKELLKITPKEVMAIGMQQDVQWSVNWRWALYMIWIYYEMADSLVWSQVVLQKYEIVLSAEFDFILLNNIKIATTKFYILFLINLI